MPRKVSYWLITFLLIVAMGATPVMSQSSQDLEAAVQENIRAWQKEMVNTVVVGSNISAVEKIMTAKYRDKARISWGGTGNYALFFLIDDFIQARVECNVRNEVVSLPIIERKGPWVRQPNGELHLDPR